MMSESMKCVCFSCSLILRDDVGIVPYGRFCSCIPCGLRGGTMGDDSDLSAQCAHWAPLLKRRGKGGRALSAPAGHLKVNWPKAKRSHPGVLLKRRGKGRAAWPSPGLRG